MPQQDPNIGVTSGKRTPNRRPALALIGVTIGNDADFPHRSLQIAKQVDLLVCEEDRPARQLLKAAGVRRDYLKFSEHNEVETLDQVASALKKGLSVAYASDQGMPNLADPGWQLTELALAHGAEIQVVPGPSSVSAAIAACPFRIDQFFYAGFLPRQDTKRINAINQIASMPYAVVIMETPYRRQILLETLAAQLPKQRMGLLAFDISGGDECYVFDSLQRLGEKSSTLAPKRPFVLVLAPPAGGS